MRIIYIHQYFRTPSMSGGTRSYEMARRMVDAGHEVQMITSSSDGRFRGNRWIKEQTAGIQVHWLPARYDNAMSYARRLVSFGQFAHRASAYCRDLRGDIVFATSTPLTVAIPAVAASRRLSAPLVFEVRDLWPDLPIAMRALNVPFAKTAARRLERWAYANSTRVVGLSPGMCEGVARAGYPRERIRCVPNSADTALFEVPEDCGLEFRESRSWLGSRPLVVYAGTFGKVNGVEFLADVAQAMASINPEVRFLALGAGGETENVKNRARALNVLGKTFFIEGPRAKADMPAVLSAATICVSLFIPLKPMWDNSANKFFDALAAGRPVAINYGGWQADLLQKSGAGVVMHPTDPQLAAGVLDAMISNDSKLASARRASRHLAHNEFSRDRTAQDLLRVLEEAVAEQRQLGV
jgi:glycosyltransferase involved in cell wall biosynthesis